MNAKMVEAVNHKERVMFVTVTKASLVITVKQRSMHVIQIHAKTMEHVLKLLIVTIVNVYSDTLETIVNQT